MIMARPMTSPGAFISESYTIGSMALPQNEAGLRHYIDTILQTDESVVATSNGFKTSNHLPLVSEGR